MCKGSVLPYYDVVWIFDILLEGPKELDERRRA